MLQLGRAYLSKLVDNFLPDVRGGDVLLSHGPHQSALDWGQVLRHVVSVEAKTGL